MDKSFRSRVPWSIEPSLKIKTEELGIDFDALIDGIKNDKTNIEMAQQFGVSKEAVQHLVDHFYTHGVGSIMGQD